MEKQIENDKRDVRICIRLTQHEFEKIKQMQQQTTDRMLSDYVRKMLLGKPIRVLTRNQSLDLFMEEMVKLRKEINFIGKNFNQVVRKINAVQMPGELSLWLPVCRKLQEELIEKTEVIKGKIHQMGKQWLQDSSAENQ